MIRRIVKLSLKNDQIKNFERAFTESKPVILTFSGAISVDLRQDAHDPTILFTYSLWKDLESLENYRNSEFFAKTWKHVKPMFKDKAQAWSVYDYFNPDL